MFKIFITYNWFIKGGYNSYKDVFLLSEIEPLWEYGLLLSLIVIPMGKDTKLKHKISAVLYKVAIFHIVASFMLIDWKSFNVNYKWRNIPKHKSELSPVYNTKKWDSKPAKN